MITKLTLENFRCFKEFTLEGLKPVTLIAGANNVGKSTILESIFLFMNRNSSDAFNKLCSFRGMYIGLQIGTLFPRTIWEPLFMNMDATRQLTICVETNDEKKAQRLSFVKDDIFSIASMPNMQNIQDIQITGEGSYPLKMTFKSATKNDESHFILTTAGVILNHNKSVAPSVALTSYFGNRTYINPSAVSELFGKLVLKGMEKKCVEVLQMLDHRIKKLSTITLNGLSGIYADIGLPTLLSINMLGDGINKLVQIALTMLANPNSLLLIDEIENGFHYSFYPKLWEVIGRLAKEMNCQVIATTHSYECIKGATGLSDEHDDLFRFVRLENDDGVVVSKVFENDSFKYAIDKDWEVR